MNRLDAVIAEGHNHKTTTLPKIYMANFRKFGIVGVLIASVFSGAAFAECRRAHVCDNYGQNCRYQDICGSSLDLPSVGLNPLPALPSMQLKPLPSMQPPPLGTSRCEYKQVNGQWQNVCQ